MEEFQDLQLKANLEYWIDAIRDVSPGPDQCPSNLCLQIKKTCSPSYGSLPMAAQPTAPHLQPLTYGPSLMPLRMAANLWPLTLQPEPLA